MINKLKKRGTIAALIAIDAIYFSFFNPLTGNSFIIIGGCLLVGLSVYGLWLTCAQVLVAWSILPVRHQRTFSVTASLLCLFLLLLQSIGQLSLRDLLASLPLAFILYMYIVRAGQAPSLPGDSSI